MMIGALIVIVSIFIVRKVRGHDEAKDWLFEAAVGVSAVAVVAALMFLANVVWFTPAKLYNDKSTNLVAVANDNAGLTQTNALLQSSNSTLAASEAALIAKLADRNKQTNEVQSAASLAEANKVLGNAQKVADNMKNAADKTERMLADSVIKNVQERLRDTINAPIPPPAITVVEGQIDTSGIDQTLKTVRTKELAAKALALTELLPDEAILTNCVPMVEYYVRTFAKKLRELAEQHGDRLIASNFNAIAVSKRGQGNDRDVFQMERNQAWNFNIYFRKENEPGLFSLFVTSQSVDLTCRFRSKEWSYQLTGVPSDKPLSGGGDYKSLNTTNLLPVFSWIVATYNDRHPLRKGDEKEASK